MTLSEIIKETGAYYCVECGKCTGSCQIALLNTDYSPRVTIARAMLKPVDYTLKNRGIWNCLSCNICSERCPEGVKYLDFIQKVRTEAVKIGIGGECTHTGALQSLMKMMMVESKLKQKRTDWTKGLGIADKSEFLYFVGCLPYFQIVFQDLDMINIETASAVVKILNESGIKPVVSNEEVCCGHDMLWTGEVEIFKKLAKQNIEMIKKTGVKKVLFSCPECYRTFKLDYPKYFGNLEFEPVYLTEFLVAQLDKSKLKFKNNLSKKITYHDSCRLGRHLGIYESQRKILSTIPGIELIEMERSKSRSVCCGTAAWINCNSYSKQIQAERLKEAKATGASTLVTSCPKCRIHFNCTLKGTLPQNLSDFNIEIKDLAVLVSEALG